MAKLEQSPANRSRRVAVTGGLLVLAVACFGIGMLVGAASQSGPESFEATVTAVSSDGDSICVDRAEDSCGLPINLPEDRRAVLPGASVTVTEIELETREGSILAFYVRPSE